jgi:uncharacterized membrane protein
MEYFFTLKFAKVALVSIVAFIVLDFLWLGFIAKNMYLEKLGYLAVIENGSIKFNMPVGVATQIIIALALAVFVSLGIMTGNGLASSIALGAFAGFAMYVTYDLTSLSFIKDFPVSVAIFDIIWGTVQGTLSGVYVYFFTKLFA